MSQHDMVMDNGPGLSVRTDLNNCVQALVTCSSGDIEPTTMVPGQLWFQTGPATGGLTKLWVRNQTNSAWDPLAANVAASFVAKGGDTMTGSLTIKTTSGSANLVLDKASATAGNCGLYGYSGDVSPHARWAVYLGDNTAESGANAGSNFAITRYDDSGSAIDIPLSINRASGLVDITGNVLINPPAGSTSAVLYVDADAGGAARLKGRKAGSERWDLDLGNGTAESGSNAGSDFWIQRRNDAGAVVDQPFSIDRSSGIATTSQVFRAKGYQCKAGRDNPYTSNMFNLNFTGGTVVALWIDTTNLGNIAYTSDYRTKKDVAPLQSMWETVKRMRPVSFHWQPFGVIQNVDDDKQYGFIAHELQDDLIHSAAHGEKDAENTIQSLNLAPVVATLTKALQEAMARIEKLEAALARAPA